MRIVICILLSAFFLFSCSDKPSADKMQECLSNELADKAVIEAFEQQDGLSREKDGVKYYEGYFNAEIKFVANTGGFTAGDRYKVIKGTLSFMKTEKGWNCQKFEYNTSNLVKIKDNGDGSDHINASEGQSMNNPDPSGYSSRNTDATESAAAPAATTKYNIAIIDDKDGYTNVREAKSGNSTIIDRIYDGEEFQVFPDASNDWWYVISPNNVKGFMHRSCIRIIR